jgi:hypothetical protein
LREFFDDQELADHFWSRPFEVQVERRADGRALFLWNRSLKALLRLDSSYRLTEIDVPTEGIVPYFGSGDEPIGWDLYLSIKDPGPRRPDTSIGRELSRPRRRQRTCICGVPL